jgi:hypothetical protein
MTPKKETLLQTVAIGLGATSIYMLWLVAPLIDQGHGAIYHWSTSTSHLFLPPLLDFLVFWLVLTLLLMLTQRPGRLRVAVWGAMIAFVPSVAIANWAYIRYTRFNHVLSEGLFYAGLCVYLAVVLFWRSSFEWKFERVVKFASILLLLVGINGALILAEVAWFGWKARSLNVPLPLHRAEAVGRAQTGRPRVLWIVFDELSYEQVYEHRFPGVEMPNFDALASQSAVFTHVEPPEILTEKILPSLITGKPIDIIRASSQGMLLFHDPSRHNWNKLEEHDTVFQDALNLGYRTALEGWYNPYCRILPDVLDECFWTYGVSSETGMIPRGSFWLNLTMPLRELASTEPLHRFISKFHPFFDAYEVNAQQHIFDYKILSDQTDRVLDDKSIGFALLHLPVPHPGGIYDRKTGRFAIKGATYLDNLVLADKLLGHIRSKLEATGQWSSSTILVMGDHSWRTKLFWEADPGWTEEEQIASHGGGFDDRPVYIVKLPGQATNLQIDTPLYAIHTRSLLDALLGQKIRSEEDLAKWVRETGSQAR